jgi:hypothetical protein
MTPDQRAQRRLFAVIRSRGPAWIGSRPLEGQKGWESCASFMDGLEREGFVVLGGRLEGTPDVLLIVRARTPEEIVSRLAADPWSADDLPRLDRIGPRTRRLGSPPEDAGPGSGA